MIPFVFVVDDDVAFWSDAVVRPPNVSIQVELPLTDSFSTGSVWPDLVRSVGTRPDKSNLD